MGLDVKDMTLEKRKAYIQAAADEVARGKLTLGGAVKRLRENLLGLNQERFALACKISRRVVAARSRSRQPDPRDPRCRIQEIRLKISLAHLNPADLDVATAKQSKAGFGALDFVFKRS